MLFIFILTDIIVIVLCWLNFLIMFGYIFDFMIFLLCMRSIFWWKLKLLLFFLFNDWLIIFLNQIRSHSWLWMLSNSIIFMNLNNLLFNWLLNCILWCHFLNFLFNLLFNLLFFYITFINSWSSFYCSSCCFSYIWFYFRFFFFCLFFNLFFLRFWCWKRFYLLFDFFFIMNFWRFFIYFFFNWLWCNRPHRFLNLFMLDLDLLFFNLFSIFFVMGFFLDFNFFWYFRSRCNNLLLSWFFNLWLCHIWLI